MVMARQYATRLPAAEPLPGPTGMPLFLACLMKSSTMRKYREAHALNDVKLLEKPVIVMELFSVAQSDKPPFKPCPGLGLYDALKGMALRHRKLRQMVLSQLELKVAPLGYLDGVEMASGTSAKASIISSGDLT